jgi:hypothetical protein
LVDDALGDAESVFGCLTGGANGFVDVEYSFRAALQLSAGASGKRGFSIKRARSAAERRVAIKMQKTRRDGSTCQSN